MATRVSSSLSIIGTLFIVGTFLSCPDFRQPINRLVFYASWGNLLSSVATMISRSGITAGETSPLCLVQSFLIQMFIPADALWNLAMATNVYLSIFKNYNATDLRKLEWRYLALCYGIPLIPAIIYLPLETKGKGRMYGPATIWCSISKEWAVFRIATFYAPVWAFMLITFTIYALVGNKLYQARRWLHNSTIQPPKHFIQSPIRSQKTTNVENSELASSCYDMDIKVRVDSPSMDPVKIEFCPMERGQSSHTHDSISHSVVPENHVARRYTQYALLFFVALICTWIPASANRAYVFVHPDTHSFSLNILESLVLPSQGLWNALIYINTTRPVCRRFCESLWARCTYKQNPSCTQTTIEMPSRRRDEESDNILSLARRDI